MGKLWGLVQEKKWDVLLKALNEDQDTLEQLLKEERDTSYGWSQGYTEEESIASYNRQEVTQASGVGAAQTSYIHVLKVNINELVKYRTLISNIAEAGQVEIFKVLAEKHQLVDQTFSLYFTSQARDVLQDQAMLDMYLAKGLDINKGLISLARYSKEAAEAAVRLCIENGADLNHTHTQDTGRKVTVLSEAAGNSDGIRMVKLLLSLGADANNPEVPAIFSSETYSNEGYKEIAALLRQYANPFGAALRDYKWGVAFKLLQETNPDGTKKYDVNAYNGLHVKPINIVIESDSAVQVEKLLKAGAKLDKESVFFVKHSDAVLSLLVKAGADLNGVGSLNHTHLEEAALRGDSEKVEMLLRHGASPHVSSSSISVLGQQVLSFRATDDKETQEAIVAALLAAGADANEVFNQELRNPYQNIDAIQYNTPIKLAEAYGKNPQVLKMLEDAYSAVKQVVEEEKAEWEGGEYAEAFADLFGHNVSAAGVVDGDADGAN